MLEDGNLLSTFTGTGVKQVAAQHLAGPTRTPAASAPKNSSP
jgi:hypothetical protein